MKKSMFLAALVLISASCFAQKNPALKKAKSYMNAETPDFGAARAAIAEALEAEPTAETYFQAGLIGYRQVERENNNQLMGLAPDVAAIGEAVEESYEYWLKADELAQVLTEKKGKQVPTDPKMRGKIAKMMLSYYKGHELLRVGELIRYASYLSENRDYAGAYKAFKMHTDIPDLVMMQNEKLQRDMPRDTTYYLYKYYAARFAAQAEMHSEAVEILEQMKDGDYEAIEVNQYLFVEYMALKDTAKAVAALQAAVARFPQEPWFLQNLINHYIFSGQEQTAIDYLAQAIEREPNVAQYHLIKGTLDENQGNHEAALVDFDNALAIDPNLAEAMAGKGRVYYNQAVKLNQEATLINDNKEYKKALDEMTEVFRKSLPFFEKAHELDPKDRDYILTLKGLYYRFGMEDKEQEMREKLENL